MRLLDIVTQLQLVLPKYTDYFSETITVNSIVTSGNVATINAPNHGLLNNAPVTISDVAQDTPMDSVSQDGLVFTFGVPSKHDLTYGFPGYETVTLGGFTDTNWNGTFNLVAVHSRTAFKVQSTNTIPTLNGNEYITEVRADGINGAYPISLIDADSFSIAGEFNDGDYSVGTIKAAVRIAGSVSIERTLEEYTANPTDSMWAMISMNDVIASKDRNTLNDSTATFARGNDVRLRLIDGFSIFLLGNCTGEIAAESLIDVFRHDLLEPILKSLYGIKFTTGLSDEGDFKTVLIGHNFVLYDRAVLVYQYNFQFTYDITQGDAAEDSDTRAFAELDNTQDIGGDDTTDMTFEVDLPNP